MLKPFEARMLSGGPFTSEEIKNAFGTSQDEVRLIESRVRQFYRQGFIRHERQGLRLTWIATDDGKNKLYQENR
jgi:hypothetical protein